jgi:cob(I)alamin adenosyltransferase
MDLMRALAEERTSMTERKKAGIYTRKGDKGQTSLGSKNIVLKTHYRIHASGSLDEFNCIIGLAMSYCNYLKPEMKLLSLVQEDLFVIGASIGGCDDVFKVDQDRISYFEEMIDELNSKVEPLKNFIMPGGKVESSWFHWLRAACRRVERDVVMVNEIEDGAVDPNILVYLNRLSDLLFILARYNNDKGKSDKLWNSKEQPNVEGVEG